MGAKCLWTFEGLDPSAHKKSAVSPQPFFWARGVPIKQNQHKLRVEESQSLSLLCLVRSYSGQHELCPGFKITS